VQNADVDMVFRKDTDGLWEELHQSSRRIRAHGSGIDFTSLSSVAR
jgi:hypothetical protein